MRFKFFTDPEDSNYVRLEGGPNNALSFHKGSRSIEWRYTKDGDLFFSFDEVEHHIKDMSDIEFNGVPLSSAADFETQIKALFPGYAGGDGSNTIYSANGQINSDRTVDLNGNEINFYDVGGVQLFLDPHQNNIDIKTSASLYISMGNDANGIQLTANNDTKIWTKSSDNTIAYTAATHTFNGDTIISNLAGGGTTGLSIDNDGKIIRTP